MDILTDYTIPVSELDFHPTLSSTDHQLHEDDRLEAAVVSLQGDVRQKGPHQLASSCHLYSSAATACPLHHLCSPHRCDQQVETILMATCVILVDVVADNQIFCNKI